MLKVSRVPVWSSMLVRAVIKIVGVWDSKYAAFTRLSGGYFTMGGTSIHITRLVAWRF